MSEQRWIRQYLLHEKSIPLDYRGHKAAKHWMSDNTNPDELWPESTSPKAWIQREA